MPMNVRFLHVFTFSWMSVPLSLGSEVQLKPGLTQRSIAVLIKIANLLTLWIRLPVVPFHVALTMCQCLLQNWTHAQWCVSHCSFCHKEAGSVIVTKQERILCMLKKSHRGNQFICERRIIDKMRQRLWMKSFVPMQLEKMTWCLLLQRGQSIAFSHTQTHALCYKRKKTIHVESLSDTTVELNLSS